MLRLFRAVCTGTRPGLTPAIRAGKGWRGRRESDSHVFCHPDSVQLCAWQDRLPRVTQRSEPPPPPPPQPPRPQPQPPPQPPQRRFTQVNCCVNLLWNPSCRAMSDSAGPAARRRGRRLRAWHRHVKMALPWSWRRPSTTAHSPRGLWWQGQERWRSRTSTKRYDDRRLLHQGCTLAS